MPKSPKAPTPPTTPTTSTPPHSPTSPLRASIEWHPATDLPDSDTTVLIALDPDAADPFSEPVFLGFYDSACSCWREANGARVEVTHWAHLPNNPVP